LIDLIVDNSTGPSLADRYSGDRYTARGLQRAETIAFSVLDKIKSLPPGMAESFVYSFAKGDDSLLAQQDVKLASRKEFPPTLPESLGEETPLLYGKVKGRAMTSLEIVEEREIDASRQRRRDEKAADAALATQVEEKITEENILETAWAANT
jgi:hypothetical protein